jgi:hypothetical protein
MNRTAFLGMVVAAVAVLLPAMAAAAPPTQFTSSAVVTSAIVASSRAADGNTFYVVDGTIPSTGTLSGTFVGVSQQVVFADGSGGDHVKYTFTGSTPCGSGSFEISGAGKLYGENQPVDSETGHFTSVDNASNTIGIHVDVDFTRVGNDLTFTGTYHCQ